MPRKLTPPWSIIEHEESFEVQTASGLKLAFVYFDERKMAGTSFDKLTRDEARRVAANIAKLPRLLKPDA